MNLKNFKKSFITPFHGWGLTGSRLEPVFTTKFPETLSVER